MICEALEQAAQYADQNMVSISFVKPSDETSTQNLDQLDKSFMYTKILKEILVTIDFEQNHINEFLTFCRESVVGNTYEHKNIEKLEKEYHRHQPIWWYTNNIFLYSMLNRALRTMDVDVIIKMGFFVRDLHRNISASHFKQYGGHQQSDSFTVYRGQGLSKTDFNQLIKTKGGLMSFNNFLSTSLNRAVSLAFAESNDSNPDLIGILFQMTVNPSISTTPFANIGDVSQFQTEEEILFSMHSVFRIENIERIDENNRLFKVDLTLTSDNDPQLHALTKSISEELIGPTGWDRLGHLMIKLGHFNKAEQLYESLLTKATDENTQAHFYHMIGLVKIFQGEHTEAVEFCEKALEIEQKTLPPNHPGMATF
jgi:tetratricopeptide (TPR) repeat protein